MNDDSVTGAVEARRDAEGRESSWAFDNGSRLSSAVVLLYTSQEGSGQKR